MQHLFDNIETNELDVLSLDLDGNDYYFVLALLKMGILPKLFILEYNAKFPPPVKWTIKYDANHSWDNTDYQGASLALFSELLSDFSYSLVCCNAGSGANAFFVRNEYRSHFADVFNILKILSLGADISYINDGATRHRQKLSSKCSAPKRQHRPSVRNLDLSAGVTLRYESRIRLILLLI